MSDPAFWEEAEVVMRRIRDQLFDLLEHHEQSVHAGNPCWSSRIGMIGFLCHCLAVRNLHLHVDVPQALAWYDEHCPDLRCQPGGNGQSPSPCPEDEERPFAG